MWTGTPAKLYSGGWGAWVKGREAVAELKVGDAIRIDPFKRSGWEATISKVVWRDRNRDLALVELRKGNANGK